MRLAWRQTAQNYGPDGAVDFGGMPFAPRLILTMLDLSYRQVGVQLLLSSALVGAAVLVLHHDPSWAKVRRVRWEVLGAGILNLVAVVGLILANLYVMTAPRGAAGGLEDFIGQQPLTGVTLVSLAPLLASVFTLAVVALWWLRLEPATVGSDDSPDDVSDAEALDDVGGDDRDESVEQAPAVSPPVPAQAPLDPSDSLGNGAALGYPQDWSPEDFQPPR
ncbi:MAG: hypothetical protein ABIW49_01040 [Knoellia sp.]